MSRIINAGPIGIVATAMASMLFALGCTSDGRPNALPDRIREIPAEMSIAIGTDIGTIESSKPASREGSNAQRGNDVPRHRTALARRSPSASGSPTDVAPMEHAHLAVERLRSEPSANVPYRLVPRHPTSVRLREHAPVSTRTQGGAQAAIVIDMEQ